MGTLTFGRLPMCYENILLRGGFSLFRGRLLHLMAAVFRQLDAVARFLIVVDSAPSSDAPLFAEGLRRWKRQQHSPEVIAELMREVGFSAQVETAECLRRALRGSLATGAPSTPSPKRSGSAVSTSAPPATPSKSRRE